MCFLIALLRTQRIGQQMTGLRLGGAIAAGQRQGFARAPFRLFRIIHSKGLLGSIRSARSSVDEAPSRSPLVIKLCAWVTKELVAGDR